MKKTVIILVVLVLLGVGAYVVFRMWSKGAEVAVVPTNTEQPPTNTKANNIPEVPKPAGETVIGKSVEGRDITAYHFGTGGTKILFVGGIHGGYEWNTVLVADEMIDYFKANPKAIPNNIQVTVIPVLNPDGLAKVVGTTGRFTKADVSASKDIVVSGRYNANKVDLNRNFDCDWQKTGVWQSTPVSGGSAAFSEPESMAIKNYVESEKPAAVVVWYSAVGGVFSSNCHAGVLSATRAMTTLFAKASGYKAYESFDFYATTGDMVNWLARKNIPAISVLLSTHDDTEWDKNLAGIKALLQSYAK